MDADVVYENVKSSKDSSPRRRSAKLDVVPQAEHRVYPRWLWIVMWLSCSGNILLAVVAMRVGTRVYGIHPEQNKHEYMDWAHIQIARGEVDMDQWLTIKPNAISTLNGCLWFYRKGGNCI